MDHPAITHKFRPEKEIRARLEFKFNPRLILQKAAK